MRPRPYVRAINCGSSRPDPLLAGSEYAVASTVMCCPGPRTRAYHSVPWGTPLDARPPPLAVTPAHARRVVGGDAAVLHEPERAGVFVAAAPAADADHLVERRPLRK